MLFKPTMAYLDCMNLWHDNTEITLRKTYPVFQITFKATVSARGFEGSIDVKLPIYFVKPGGQLTWVFDLRSLSYLEHCIAFRYVPPSSYLSVDLPVRNSISSKRNTRWFVSNWTPSDAHRSPIWLSWCLEISNF